MVVVVAEVDGQGVRGKRVIDRLDVAGATLPAGLSVAGVADSGRRRETTVAQTALTLDALTLRIVFPAIVSATRLPALSARHRPSLRRRFPIINIRL